MNNPGLAEFTDAYTLDEEDLLDVYALMLLVRTLDERVWTMNRQGKAAIVASSQGHEAGQLAAVWALRNNAPDFFCFTYYRDLAITTALGLTPEQSLLGFLAKNGEPLSGARQFPQHGAAPELKFINPSNVIGTHVPQAVGWALAVKMRKENTVVACFFGDGTTSQGEVHEAMNFASVHKLPIVFFVENNKYAISVPVSRQMAIEHVSARAAGYDMPGVTVDGTDVRASYLASSHAPCASRLWAAARASSSSTSSVICLIRATTTIPCIGTGRRSRRLASATRSRSSRSCSPPRVCCQRSRMRSCGRPQRSRWMPRRMPPRPRRSRTRTTFSSTW